MVFFTLKSFSSPEKLKVSAFAQLSADLLLKRTYEQKTCEDPSKLPIKLQIGDATIFGNFSPPKELVEALRKAIEVDKFSYNPGPGRLEAREAVAEYSRSRGNIKADDVFLTLGCNQALEFCILTLVAPGENVLIPSPCYTYRPLVDGLGIVSKGYNLDPNRDWEVDLKHMESVIDDKTRAIVVNHPGNPCGNVFSKQHILDIIAIAERYKLPVIADEIYEYMVFPGVEFHPIASLSKNVPVLTCSGLTKRFVVPGIRMGWIIVSDRNGALIDVKEGLKNCSARLFGVNSTVQIALPDILKKTPQQFFDENMKIIARHASTVYNLLKKAPGLHPIMPKGSMFMTIKIEFEKFPEFSTSHEFSEELTREQNVQVFPCFPCFHYEGFIRVVLIAPENILVEACERIIEFCEKHFEL